jgi:hypothetical protein
MANFVKAFLSAPVFIKQYLFGQFLRKVFFISLAVAIPLFLKINKNYILSLKKL